jgi:hypothetical protein
LRASYGVQRRSEKAASFKKRDRRSILPQSRHRQSDMRNAVAWTLFVRVYANRPRVAQLDVGVSATLCAAQRVHTTGGRAPKNGRAIFQGVLRRSDDREEWEKASH